MLVVECSMNSCLCYSNLVYTVVKHCQNIKLAHKNSMLLEGALTDRYRFRYSNRFNLHLTYKDCSVSGHLQTNPAVSDTANLE